MTGLRSRFGFCVATAVIAASIADPIVEFWSNAGLFGSGHYTDRSNLGVFPTLLAGFGLLSLFLARRAPAILAGRGLPRNVVSSLPAIFVLQLGALYLMETSEQLVVYGHLLAPTIWLGAPAPVSLAIHAAIGLAVTCAVVRWRRPLAVTTLRVIRLIRAIATLAAVPAPARVARRPALCTFKELCAALCAIGVRAPPGVMTHSFYASSLGGDLCHPHGGYGLPA